MANGQSQFPGFNDWSVQRCLWLVIGSLFFVVEFAAGLAESAGDRVCFARQCINVEIVREREEIRRGLQFRDSLGANSGMLFVFKKSGLHAFWMKDTLIPLDMIWMDDTQRIVHIEYSVPPCAAAPCPSYPPKQAALYVLEINAGYAEKFGLQLGDTAEFRLKEAGKPILKNY